MTMSGIFSYAMVVGLATLGGIFLAAAACNGLDEGRAIAGCALLATARYMS